MEVSVIIEVSAETLDDEIPMDIGLGSIKNEVLKMLQTGGPKAVVEYLQMTTASWKSATVKIAVAGKSKAGKSSFINAIRGVDHTDEAFAKEGRGEKSLDVQEYRHTKNKRIIYCDLPGYGNISMTRKTFLEKVQLLEYDIFLIFVYPVPSEDDAWLVAQLMEADRGFCFVRAKIDQDMKNAPKMGKTEKDVLVEIREKVSSAVKVMPAIEDVELFLISKKNLSIGEMDELIAFIEMKIPKLKFEAVLLTLTAFSNQVIEKKYQFFKDRISSLSLAIALDGDIKYHGYFLAYSEIMMYFEAFELNAIFDPEIPNLTHPFSESCIYKLLDSLREKVPGVFKQIVPIYNWVATYRVCKRFFTQLLDELKMDYCKMMKFFKKQRENIGISPDGDICPSDCPCVKIKQITF
ncbi:unnamed protein product [Mytilus coruscus]|uniref:IRG-type G domain-containing protein n=1 Tax=Mytilus coruscus TaxID=42192 RepID=A0A6J8B6Y3_MYTCO|nr:unnamed protein product [Mytilus coruscus]